jgi:hypothetical protein
MTIISRNRSIVHPYTRSRPVRPFGLGVLELAVPPINRIAKDLPGRSWIAPAETVEPGIPAAAVKIRVNGLSGGGVWVRHMTTHPAPIGTPWKFETDLGRKLDPATADAWYRAGRVSILAEVPVAPPAPTDPGDVESDPADWPAWTDEYRWESNESGPAWVDAIPSRRGFNPDPVDAAWEVGFSLYASGETGEAPAGSPTDVVAAWNQGALHGARQYDADMDLESEKWELMTRVAACC